ncbi:hypothetical protein ACVINZ_001651 [Mesorhizobium jarvisii]
MSAPAQMLAGQPGQDDDDAEHRQRQQLCQNARNAEHKGSAEGDEIPRHMRGEQALQRQEAGRVDIAAIEAQQQRQCGLHGAVAGTRKR